MTDLLEEYYEISAKEHVGRTLDFLYENLDQRLLDGKFDEVVGFLKSVDIEKVRHSAEIHTLLIVSCWIDKKFDLKEAKERIISAASDKFWQSKSNEGRFANPKEYQDYLQKKYVKETGS